MSDDQVFNAPIIKDLLGDEEIKIKDLLSKMELLDEKISKSYESIFPIACPQCQEEYDDMQSYLDKVGEKKDQLTELEMVDIDKFIVKEVRHCSCGHSLFQVEYQQRDQTRLGHQLRKCFDRCVLILVERGKLPPDAAIQTTRALIRYYMNLYVFYRSS